MNSSFELLEMARLGLVFLTLAMSAASLTACIVYRRASPAMILLILAFAGDVVVAFLYLMLGVVNTFMLDLVFDSMGVVYFLVGLLGVATAALTAVGLFQVLGDVTRRLDRYAAGSPDEDYRRRRPAYDEGGDPRWEPRPGGPDIRR